MSIKLDIAVAGCGISGMGAALLLAREGHRITIFERFDQARPVGSGLMLQPTGLAVLNHMGLRGAIHASGAPITRILGRTADKRRLVLDVNYSALKNGSGVAVHRPVLFNALFTAAQVAGAQIQPGHTIAGTELVSGGKRRLTFANCQPSAAFDLVIDSLGAFSPLRPVAPEPLDFGALWTTVPWEEADGFTSDWLEQRYRGARQMVGILPCGDTLEGRNSATFFWSLRGADLPAWNAQPFEAWKAEATALWPRMAPLLARITNREMLTFARYAHATTWAPAAPAFVHIGDSYHATSPQLGQGANFGLIDAATLAHSIEQTPTLPDALIQYTRARRLHIALYQTLSYLFTPAYQSDKAWPAFIRDHVLSNLLNVWPAQPFMAALVSGVLCGPLGKIGLRGLVR
ncbi:FAD-dependent monooxygenase [Pacificimonas sp. WHA3]|uniref:FAD-dependent monooxygenase n=1 Tax=Pacificimonas pallii TaxID=2827236 RepID=A0ABS6SGS6_9SPHN|nr:NAD(P)/FAD-dependent oxidoreductase [Pacificimonas pallii]MBV7257623.1 FAD-dependent monooxygenase [Pacificimonas pallii]